tara:strand:+ start:5755 stop:7197 length:1443 start_codon:yes stop_codon:yes gene_type:complete
MPGPRKNLTPLDMKMMGLAFNQGGIINFLGQQPEVTAPVRAQSHADSPPVQLTYITDAEKDLLVNANIHGSMNGKPNPGPAGLESLDDFFTKPGGGIGGGSTADTGGSGGSYGGGEDFGSPYGGGSGSPPGSSDEGDVPYGGKPPPDDDDDDDDDNQGDSTPTTPKKPPPKTDEEKEATKAKKPVDLLKVLQNKALGQKALSQQQLVRIANLLAANKKNSNVLNDEEESVFSDIFNLDDIIGKVDNYRDNYPDYFEGKIPGTGAVVMGFADSLMAGNNRDDGKNLLGLGDDGIGSLTLQGLNKALTSSEKQFLKNERPDLFYGTSSVPGFGAQTSGGLADLASLDAQKYANSDDPKLKAFANQIFAARADLDRMGKDMFGNTQGGGNQGGGGGAFVPPVVTPDDPIIPVDPIPAPGTTPPSATPTPKYPGSVLTDYTQLGLPNIYGNQQMPNYATFNRATGQPVGLQNYLDNLKKRFGIG